MRVHLLIIIVVFFSSAKVEAQTTSNTINPDWDGGGDWTGNAPGYDMSESAILDNNSTITDPITVNDGYTLTINAGAVLTTNEVITVKEGGTLIVNGTITGTDGGKEFKIEKGTFIVNSGGSFNWDGYWTSNDNPATITVNGSVSVEGNLDNSVTIEGGGSISVLGTLNNGGEIFGCDDGGADCCPAGVCALPVELLHFEATKRNNATVIFWSTASELNNDFFTVLRSEDHITWVEVATISGAGNSSSILNYQFIDHFHSSSTVYYQLKQTDYDEAYSYSSIISVSNLPLSFSIYPNPSDEFLILEMKDIEQNKMMIFNSTGRKVQIPSVISKDKILLDTSGLKNGVYFVKIVSTSTTLSSNFVKH
ncbi:MAG: T9SS type A sorting domain-containing protein [Reichenbachiella sp.]